MVSISKPEHETKINTTIWYEFFFLCYIKELGALCPIYLYTKLPFCFKYCQDIVNRQSVINIIIIPF